ncbi:MAG: hypothetical protein MUF13_17670 [Akkermansiaceae bacterium]|nr:hypothetical protein [Akkermansiaceae bacterium]
MKIPRYRKGILLASLSLGSWLAAPSIISAQEAPPTPPPAPAERGGDGAKAEKRMERGRKHLEELRRAGRHEEARRMEMRMRGGPQRPGPRGPLAEVQAPIQKARHLKQAAEHLKAAGYEKQADMAMEESKRIETRLREEMEQRRKQEKQAREMKEKKPERPKAKAESDKSTDAIEGEMKKMRREMEELRQQLRRMKAEREKTPPAPTPAPTP